MPYQMWAKSWDTAKQFFKDETGKRKPDAQTDGVFVKHSSGLDSRIQKVAKLYVDAAKAAKVGGGGATKALDAYKAGVKKFAADSASYGAVLEGAINQNLKQSPDGKNVYTKACRFLQKQLVAIREDMEESARQLDSDLATDAKDDVNARAIFQKVVAAAKEARAAAARVKTSPTAENFDLTSAPAHRMLTWMDLLAGARSAGTSAALGVDMGKIDELSKAIDPYAKKGRIKPLPKNANAAQQKAHADVIILELKRFTNAIKAAEDYVTKVMA